MKYPARFRSPVALALLAGAAMAIVGCGEAKDPWPAKPGLRVMTSFPPLYCFALNVAGDDASVLCLLSEKGPHDFEPTTKEALLLHKADLFLINGLDLDSTIAGRLAANCGNPKLKLVPVGDAIPKGQLRKLEEGDHAEPGHHHHGEYDPHIWLGIPEAILMVQRIRDVLSENDRAHAAGYRQRADAYIARLRELQAYGNEKLKDKKDRQLISFHDSLAYFARSFNLKIVDVIETRAGEEPSPAQLAKLVQTCVAKKVRLIAVEPQYPSDTSAKTLLQVIQKKGTPDAAFVEIDPMETAQPDDLKPEKAADFYERKLRQNLDNLAGQMQ